MFNKFHNYKAKYGLHKQGTLRTLRNWTTSIFTPARHCPIVTIDDNDKILTGEQIVCPRHDII